MTLRFHLTGNEDYYTHKDCQAMGCGFDFRVDDKLDYNDTGRYSTLVYTERAKEIITKHDAEEPLFLYMPYQAVHFPMQVIIICADSFRAQAILSSLFLSSFFCLIFCIKLYYLLRHHPLQIAKIRQRCATVCSGSLLTTNISKKKFPWTQD